MFASKIRTALLVAATSVSLAGCGYYGNGVGVGVGYGNPYGYGGYGGYGGGYGYDPYYSGYGYNPYYGSRYGYGYGYNPYYGWHNGYYYPGTGRYVYDKGGKRYPMSDIQRSFWANQPGVTVQNRTENWSGYTSQAVSGTGTNSDAGQRVRSWQRARDRALGVGGQSSQRFDRTEQRSVAVQRSEERRAASPSRAERVQRWQERAMERAQSSSRAAAERSEQPE